MPQETESDQGHTNNVCDRLKQRTRGAAAARDTSRGAAGCSSQREGETAGADATRREAPPPAQSAASVHSVVPRSDKTATVVVTLTSNHTCDGTTSPPAHLKLTMMLHGHDPDTMELSLVEMLLGLIEHKDSIRCHLDRCGRVDWFQVGNTRPGVRTFSPDFGEQRDTDSVTKLLGWLRSCFYPAGMQIRDGSDLDVRAAIRNSWIVGVRRNEGHYNLNLTGRMENDLVAALHGVRTSDTWGGEGDRTYRSIQSAGEVAGTFKFTNAAMPLGGPPDIEKAERFERLLCLKAVILAKATGGPLSLENHELLSRNPGDEAAFGLNRKFIPWWSWSGYTITCSSGTGTGQGTRQVRVSRRVAGMMKCLVEMHGADEADRVTVDVRKLTRERAPLSMFSGLKDFSGWKDPTTEAFMNGVRNFLPKPHEPGCSAAPEP